jgi:hypothetical protein
VELREPLTAPTLARRMGDAAHVSMLLRKVCHLSGLEENRVGEWLLKCAVERGASHYQREFPLDLPPDDGRLADEELGVALCLGQHPYHPAYIRAAAQLLSSSRIEPVRLVRLARMERVEPVLAYIAEVASRFGPELQPWAYLRSHLRPRVTRSDVLPHWSRFVSQTGETPSRGGPKIQWLRRRETLS